MRQYCQGVHENTSCFEMKIMTTLESDPKEHTKKWCDPAHDHEQRQQDATLQSQDQQQESNTEQRQKHMSGTYKYILVRYTTVYSILMIYQVQAPCCETTQDA